MKNTNKGFTLIELLELIAIIGILATVVLASLGNARNKANDAKAQSQLASMMAQAELYYSSQVPASYGTGTTSTACTGAGAAALFTTAASGNGLAGLLTQMPPGYTQLCYTFPTTGSASAWAVTSSGNGRGWCVDSNGNSKAYTSTTFTAPSSAVCS